ncbi:uncharacterized protein ARMOST_07019 [Armillaria ostoyae]|uniref:Uncharacterized protein n=1 Tax=Armillaria ostoyae TaxID=47428 RepID=A0A284R4M8_ARMOS|nr:uncharacterized protein ARMOST_07019 [Armillaria ostoyae]
MGASLHACVPYPLPSHGAALLSLPSLSDREKQGYGGFLRVSYPYPQGPGQGTHFRTRLEPGYPLIPMDK